MNVTNCFAYDVNNSEEAANKFYFLLTIPETKK